MRIIQKIIVAGLAMALITSYYSCVHKDPSGTLGTQTEVWEMHMTGGTVGQFQMLLNRSSIGGDVYSIEGEFGGKAKEHKMYGGMVKCAFYGKITGNDFKADFIGTGNMPIFVHVSGSLWGTISDTAGQGKYKVTHEEGGSDGEWTLKRIKDTHTEVASSRKNTDTTLSAIKTAPMAVKTSHNIKARDDRFVAYDDGTVLDTKTNLMWAAKDNGREVEWVNARSYCEDYRGGGYSDWRMPTLDELAALYDNNKTYESDCGVDVHLTELIHLTCSSPWSSERRDSSAGFFHFGGGGTFWKFRDFYLYQRALPVRSGK